MRFTYGTKRRTKLIFFLSVFGFFSSILIVLHLQGGLTLEGLKNNITVGILFIEAWLRGKYCGPPPTTTTTTTTTTITRYQVLSHCCRNSRGDVERMVNENTVGMNG